jgi:putative drug exporter of the RND superfamily
VFSTIGPALAITILVGFLASITLLPAMLTIAGRRGLVKPRRGLTSRLWRRSGVRIVLHPVRHLVASLIVLAILAGSVGAIKFNYDDRKNLPADVDSNEGYAVMAQHFPVNSSIQQFILVQSPRDLRSPKALADLEQMARRVSRVSQQTVRYFSLHERIGRFPPTDGGRVRTRIRRGRSPFGAALLVRVASP